MGIRDAAQDKLEAVFGEDANSGADLPAVDVVGSEPVAPEIPEQPAEVIADSIPVPVAPPEQQPEGDPTEEEKAGAQAAGEEAVAALPEDATDEEREQARSEAEQEFYVGTYRTREEAERGNAEKDATIQRLYAERDAALRQAEEARQAPEPEEPKEIDRAAWDTWASEAVASGAGGQGAIAALEEGGYDGYQVYMRHWMLATDEDGEPDLDARAQAALFNNDMIVQIAEVRSTAAAQKVREQPTNDDILREARAKVVARRPDYDQYAGAINQVLADMPAEDATFLTQLAQSGVDGRARAMEIVYLQAKASGLQPEKTPAAAQVEARRRETSARAATLDATTSSAEGAPARTTPPETEQIARDRKAGIRARQNLEIAD